MTIEVGNVLHLYFTVIRPPNYKYCIVVQTDPLIRCILINSDLTEFAKSTPSICDEHVQIYPNECAPLTKQSWIGCADIFGIDTKDACKTLEDHPNFHYGSISTEVAQRIVDAMSNSQTLSVIKKRKGTEHLISKYGLGR